MSTRRWTLSLIAPALLGLLCLRCSSSDGSITGAGTANVPGPSGSGANGSIVPGSNGAGSSNVGTGGSTSIAGSSSGGGGGVPIVVVPPEKELEESFLAPVVTGKFVFSANPKSGRTCCCLR